jgi:septal ring factor EnvC (AmiA/AmiB activator)
MPDLPFMNRSIFVIVLFFGLQTSERLYAQANASDAAYNEERFKNLQAKIENLADGQRMLLQKFDRLDHDLSRLSADMDRLKTQVNQSGSGMATRDELKKYAEKLKEIDEKRQADNALVMKSIKDLANAQASPAPSSKKSTKPAPKQAPSETLVEYTVGKDESLSQIINAYNTKLQSQGFKRITQSQVLKANPGLKPEKIMAGQKIRIPVPPEAVKE